MSDSVEVKLRKETGTRASRKLRREGLVPAVLYGHGEKCVDLVATREAVQAAVRHGSRVVELKGAVKTGALIRELQWDTYGVEPVHVDFLRVSATDRVKVKVPVDLKGECPGQRAGGVVSLIRGRGCGDLRRPGGQGRGGCGGRRRTRTDWPQGGRGRRGRSGEVVILAA